MGKPCRVSFLAYRDGLELSYGVGDLDDFSPANLEDGIDYCEWLISLGYTVEPHDEFSLAGYAAWARRYLGSSV